MRVALFADPTFAANERPLLDRLAISLIDEIASATIIEPRSHTPPHRLSPVHRTAWEDRGVALTRNLRVRQLADHLSADDRTPDVIHAFGRRAWSPALQLASITGAAICYEVASQFTIDQAPSTERATLPLTQLLTTDPEDDRNTTAPIPGAAFVASDPTILDALTPKLRTLRAHPAPWAVHRAPPRRPARRSDDAPASVCIITDPTAPDAALTPLHAIAALERPLLAFIDESALPRSARLWSTIEKLKLTDRVDVVPSLEAHRDITLSCDVLVIPGPTHRNRSITLDAMAAHLPIIAETDPLLENLRSPDLTRQPTPGSIQSWINAFNSAIDADRKADPIIAAAARFVDEQRKPHAHAGALLTLYNDLINPEALSFNQSPHQPPPDPPQAS